VHTRSGTGFAKVALQPIRGSPFERKESQPSDLACARISPTAESVQYHPGSGELWLRLLVDKLGRARQTARQPAVSARNTHVDGRQPGMHAAWERLKLITCHSQTALLGKKGVQLFLAVLIDGAWDDNGLG
jgi:hypothetical protein